MYGLGFWFLEGQLLLFHGGPPPPFMGLLPLSPKGPPLLLLIGTTHPLIGGPSTSLIKDGMPFYSWYNFMVKTIRGILGLCFFSE
jgi:hypothetical protein